MNKKRYIVAILLIVIMLFQFSGCKLAKAEVPVGSEGDKLIGVFVTEEYLDVMRSDLEESQGYEEEVIEYSSIEEALAASFDGKIYAEVEAYGGNNATEYTIEFKGYDGFLFAEEEIRTEDGYISTGCKRSDEITDVHVKISDDKVTYEGTLFLRDRPMIAVYTNPVYRTLEGRIYMMPGGGSSFPGAPGHGVDYSTTLTESSILREGSEVTEETFEVTINYDCIAKADKYILKTMNSEDELINSITISFESTSQVIKKSNKAAYYIIEKYEDKQVVSREIVDEDEGFSVHAFGESNVATTYYINFED